jgi:hypothetical protein
MRGRIVVWPIGRAMVSAGGLLCVILSSVGFSGLSGLDGLNGCSGLKIAAMPLSCSAPGWRISNLPTRG